MRIDFEQIRHLIPNYTFNEYGQLTGNYVFFDQIVCVRENGRIQVWLNEDAYSEKDPERLICDYKESDLSG